MNEPAGAIFLPGFLAPGAVRYGPLLRSLPPGTRAWTKELEVYAQTGPPENYSVADEVESVARLAARLRLSRFPLYGFSGGGAVALAFTAAHPEAVASLAVDEPAFDFTDAAMTELEPYLELLPVLSTAPADAVPRFIALDLQPGVLDGAPLGPPPLPNRPAGGTALIKAFQRHAVDPGAYARYDGPVLFLRGTSSADRFARSAWRLDAYFPHFEEVAFDGFSHVNPAHQSAPERVAELLQRSWAATPR
jgi:pimeloyl-ACP methyl ester carboxylesterase